MMQDNSSVPNPELGEYVTSTAFHLDLKKTHIRMICAIAHGGDSDFNGPLGGRNDLITPATGLKRRGLVLHYHDVFGRTPPGEPHRRSPWEPKGWKNPTQAPWQPLHHFYRLTRAGWAVFDLLVEAGMTKPLAKGERRRLAA